jgi:hypothetical protein
MTHRSRFGAFAALSLIVLAVAMLAPAPGSSGRAVAQSPALSGTWRLAGDPASMQTTVQQQWIEPALATLTPDIQRLARARIAESTWIPATITVVATPVRIAVTFQGAENRTFDTAPGQPQNVYSRSGVRAQLTQTYRNDGAIQQQFVAMDGTQFHWLVPDASGRTPYLDVQLQSPRIPTPIRFRLTYQRAS